ncbi:MAG: hypothetical protein A3H96_19285 [Acidobacteria bacterium RIFCSPLOWO2_02_FULL_67_36]|nr:MAG: hypothetical protein A3H96_19285 [Acidobacteria bacterium RIFCSPLOWO2_02_FULL_67_36]OFW25264.1 MAG: hypothetical protein A3G21_19810 [Acidobacteria bacterium RIFCSPLOWO2_12_FULL_66_21]
MAYDNGWVVDASAGTTWSTSDETVCDVSPDGVVSVRNEGRATITGTWKSLSASIALTAANGIRGRVLDFGTNASVPGVVVQFTGGAQEARATTDASGVYLMSMPSIGSFTVWMDGRHAGMARVTGSTYRGDLLVDTGTCISRYGTLVDARTLQPVAGATVSVAGVTTTSGQDGWYRIDLGCPSEGTIGFNTTFLYVTHPNYAPSSQVVGRGVQGVSRLDLHLEQR